MEKRDKRKPIHLPFNEAKSFVHNLGLTKNVEWKEYCKSGKKPKNIPKIPHIVYKNSGWISYGDWLGTGTIANIKKEFLGFEEARKLIRPYNFKSESEWKLFNKTSDKLKLVPTQVASKYKNSGWISMGDFLGSGITSNSKKEFLDFEDARDFVRSLGFKLHKEWVEYSKSDKKPTNIPASPQQTYKKIGWLSWGDFLGTKIGVKAKKSDFFDFKEAKSITTKAGLTSIIEYKKYIKSNPRLPSHPDEIYKKENMKKENKGEWKGWADFLGYVGNGKHIWTKLTLINFLKSLHTELVNLDSVELITIINSNNLAKKISELGSLEEFIAAEGGSERRRQTLNQILNQLEDTDEESFTDDATETELETELVEGTNLDIPEETQGLQLLNPIAELHMYDNNSITASLDDENIDFLMKNQLNKLWNRVINKDVLPEILANETGGDRFTIIKNWFFNEYNQLLKLELPKEYNFKDDKGKLIQPNLMQRLTVHRLINEKSYGNWSGTGAGKTLSAVLAGRVAGAKATVIICNNATVEGWVNSINEYFTNNKVYVKQKLDDTPKDKYILFKKYDIKLNPNDNNYLVINYEMLQQEDSEYVISELLKNNKIDYIILDEVQNVKQREEGVENESARRDVTNKLIIASREKNSELLVLAMSATPIINNLTEPKKLIELLTSEVHNELDTRENIINGIEMYKALTRYGLRYRPKNDIRINQELIEIDGTHLTDKLIGIRSGAIVEFEKALLKTKLDSVKGKIQKGTLIYTHYVTELCGDIGTYVKGLGLTIGYYTGEDKTGLKAFKKGEIDVLIGSSPISTGVDGIQKVCNTLIPLVLPWTSAEYDQLVGRVDRQGSNFDHVNIYVPQVVIPMDNGEWSWDKRRFNIIRFKATLADLAVDGRVPLNLLPSKAKLMEDAKNELKVWVERLNDDNVITFEREEIKIPLNPQFVAKNITKYGDFSQMNQRWGVSNSQTTNKRLTEDPTEWFQYHTLYRESRATWSEIPYKEIAKQIKRKDYVVADLGCGENLLKGEISNKVLSFDHVAIDNTVTACDISKLPLEDDSIDVAVFSLSLMGSNYESYLKEAYRVLKHMQPIMIAETAKQWRDNEDEFKRILISIGFDNLVLRESSKFIYVTAFKM